MTALQSDSVAEITKALIQAMRAFKPAVKDSENPHFRSKFVSLEGVYDAVRDALLDNGIASVQPTKIVDGKTVLVTKLLHTSGEWLSGEYPVNAVKQDPQGEGSAMTYARRYALMAMVGIAPEDDDGNAASAQPNRPARSRAPRPVSEAELPAVNWDALMDMANTRVQLKRIGDDLATSDITGAERDRLRALYNSRWESLR